jgi:hypothetical protein
MEEAGHCSPKPLVEELLELFVVDNGRLGRGRVLHALPQAWEQAQTSRGCSRWHNHGRKHALYVVEREPDAGIAMEIDLDNLSKSVPTESFNPYHVVIEDVIPVSRPHLCKVCVMKGLECLQKLKQSLTALGVPWLKKPGTDVFYHQGSGNMCKSLL